MPCRSRTRNVRRCRHDSAEVVMCGFDGQQTIALLCCLSAKHENWNALEIFGLIKKLVAACFNYGGWFSITLVYSEYIYIYVCVSLTCKCTLCLPELMFHCFLADSEYFPQNPERLKFQCDMLQISVMCNRCDCCLENFCQTEIDDFKFCTPPSLPWSPHLQKFSFSSKSNFWIIFLVVKTNNFLEGHTTFKYMSKIGRTLRMTCRHSVQLINVQLRSVQHLRALLNWLNKAYLRSSLCTES